MANMIYRFTDVPDSRSGSSVKADKLTYQEMDTNLILLNQAIEQNATDIANTSVKQVLSSVYSNNEDISGIIPLDNTKPQNTEGTQIVTLSVTPQSATSNLVIEFEGTVSATSAGVVILALFVDNDLDAIYTTLTSVTAAGHQKIKAKVVVPSTNTTARVYKVRVGASVANVFRMNGGLSAPLFDGTMNSILTVTEVK